MGDTGYKNTPSEIATINRLQEVTSIEREGHSIFGPGSSNIALTLGIQMNDNEDFKLPPLKSKGRGLNGFKTESISAIEKEDLEDVSGNASSRGLKHEFSKPASESSEIKLKRKGSSGSFRSVKRGISRKGTSRSSKSKGVMVEYNK